MWWGAKHLFYLFLVIAFFVVFFAVFVEVFGFFGLSCELSTLRASCALLATLNDLFIIYPFTHHQTV